MFKNFIDNQILLFPTLYLKDTYEQSELSVLDHIFFVIGNGFEWENGYPLKYVSDKHIKHYHKKDMNLFFEMYDKIWYINIDDEDNKRFLRDFDYNYLEQFSNKQFLYITDSAFAEDYNQKAKDKFSVNVGKIIFCDHNRLFEPIKHMNDWKDKWRKSTDSIFYSILEYSKINEMFNQSFVQKETLQYAKKLIDYAENYYIGKDEKELTKIKHIKEKINDLLSM